MVKISNILIGVLVFGMVMVGLLSVASSVFTTYGVKDTTNITRLMGDYDTRGDMETIQYEAGDFVMNKTVTEGSASENLNQNLAGVAKMVYRMPGIIGTLMGTAFGDLHIPRFFRDYWMAMILISIAMAILGIFWRTKT